MRPGLVASWTGVALLLCSCAAEPQQSPDGWRDLAARDTERGLSPTTENGLAIRDWQIKDRPDVVAAALAAYANEPGLDEETMARLERNGLRFFQVPAEDVESLLADLGGASPDVRAWHGQVLEWREIATAPIEPSGRAVAIDGRVRRLRGGSLRLMIRSWTVDTENGPRLHLEMLPDYDLTRRTRMEQILGTRVFEGERYRSLQIDLLLEPLFAYVLTCERPGVEWESKPQEDEAAPPITEPEEAADEFEPPGAIGPIAPPPVTLGEILLKRAFGETGPGLRQVIVFLPRIPFRLYPPDLRAEVDAVGRSTDQ